MDTVPVYVSTTAGQEAEMVKQRERGEYGPPGTFFHNFDEGRLQVETIAGSFTS